MVRFYALNSEAPITKKSEKILSEVRGAAGGFWGCWPVREGKSDHARARTPAGLRCD